VVGTDLKQITHLSDINLVMYVDAAKICIA
jgi:hypothetical protein